MSMSTVIELVEQTEYSLKEGRDGEDVSEMND